mgnify:CR=1 FL=1
MYPAIDLMYEKDRLDFIYNRDGKDAAIKFAKQTIKVYLATVTNYKNKKQFNHPYRFGYTESAMSARHILRNYLNK